MKIHSPTQGSEIRDLYENARSLHSSPSTGEAGVGVIFMLRYAPTGHGG